MRFWAVLLTVLLLLPAQASADIVINMPGNNDLKIATPPNAPAQGVVPNGAPNLAPGSGMRGCTQMWCNEGLLINLPPVTTPGQYQFTVKTEEDTYICTGTLPLKRCGTPSSSCNKPGILVGESGCALPPNGQSFSSLIVQKIPRAVEVEVTLPGRQPSSIAMQINPQCHYPNGQQCDPRPCCQAQISVPVR